MERRPIPRWFWAAAIAPRLAMLAPIAWRAEPALTGDSLGYWTLAQNLLHHGAFSLSLVAPYTPETVRTPGYPVFLAMFAALFRSPLVPVAIAQSLVGIATAFVTYQWLGRWAGKKGAFLGACVLALDPIILLHTPLLMTESLYILFQTCALSYTWKACRPENDDGSIADSAIAGGLWSAATLVRPISLYLPVLLSPFWLGRKKALFVFLFCAYFLPAAWTARNWKATGHIVFSSIGGRDLLRYPAAGVESLRTGIPMAEIDQELRRQVDQAHPLGYANSAEQGAAYGSAALPILKFHPVLVARYCFWGAVKVLGGTGLEMVLDWAGSGAASAKDQEPRADVTGQGTAGLLRAHHWLIPLEILYIAALGTLYFLSLKGFSRLWHGGEKARALLLAGTTLYFLLMASSQGYYRFRIPLMPPLAAAAAAAL